LRFWLALHDRLGRFGLPLAAGLPLCSVGLPRLGATVFGLARAAGTAPELLSSCRAGGGGQGQDHNPASNARHAPASMQRAAASRLPRIRASFHADLNPTATRWRPEDTSEPWPVNPVEDRSPT